MVNEILGDSKEERENRSFRSFCDSTTAWVAFGPPAGYYCSSSSPHPATGQLCQQNSRTKYFAKKN